MVIQDVSRFFFRINPGCGSEGCFRGPDACLFSVSAVPFSVSGRSSPFCAPNVNRSLPIDFPFG